MSPAVDPHADVTREVSAASLDADAFHELLASLGQAAAVAAVYRKFVANAAAFICDLRNQDRARCFETLHTLKGSASMMGARRMTELSVRIYAQLQCSAIQAGAAADELERELETFRIEAAARLRSVGVILEP